MRLSLLSLAFALTASTIAQYDNQTAPFHLVLVSEDDTVNGEYLASCHEGAGIEALCLAGKPSPSKPDPTPGSVYYFNYSTSVETPNATLGTPGYVTWVLHGGNFNESQALGLWYSPATNIAIAMFWPGLEYAWGMAFDTNDMLNIQYYVDDTVTPPKAGDTTGYYNWYACTTYFTGYTYDTLSWVAGDGSQKPQNPSCAKVGVKRVFI
ncbi:hypothetical protein EJ04DRAFT_508508 [Polyplosphaeria fusca]|uniref:DUF7907 domain-containing protein n=1 Tax=Polyplosphaeria fusca TaxID=682080 RepID=A0A9P4V7J3_9PLEO|nr:hypothetical protein EJ04DRAFT_508508 [Polyplosphaeria fusca]